MSSSSPRRPDRRRAVGAALLSVLLWVAPAAPAAAAPLPAVAVLPGRDQVSVVVDVAVGTRAAPPESASVTLDDVPQRVTVSPVMSRQLAVALVVDASTSGAPALPGWLSAAARFVLETPPGARAAVVTDTVPPRLAAPLQARQIDVVRTLSGLQPAAGGRSTAEAITLAVQQLPPPSAGPRVVLVYTTAPDAGGEPAQALGERLAGEQVILAVVGRSTASAYWSTASQATGGFFAPAGATRVVPQVVPALDQVATTLRGRYLLTFPTPERLPATVSVRVKASGIQLTGEVVVPPRPGGPTGGSSDGVPISVVLWAVAGAISLMLLVALAAWRWDRTPRERPRPTAGPGVATGRAPVPESRPRAGPGVRRRPLPPAPRSPDVRPRRNASERTR